MERNVNIVKDVNGNNIVIINDIRFKGKRSVDWDDVKAYLEDFVGEFYEIAVGKKFEQNREMKHLCNAYR